MSGYTKGKSLFTGDAAYPFLRDWNRRLRADPRRWCSPIADLFVRFRFRDQRQAGREPERSSDLTGSLPLLRETLKPPGIPPRAPMNERLKNGVFQSIPSVVSL